MGEVLLVVVIFLLATLAFAIEFFSRQPEAEKPDYKAAIAYQALKADRRQARQILLDENGVIPLIEWISIAARRLVALWPSMTLGDAMGEIEEELRMAEIVYPDLSFDWTASAAIEFSEQYARDYGEEFGANE